MKPKLLFRTQLIVIFFYCVAFTLGLSHDAKADCILEGYVFHIQQIANGAGDYFWFREKPIDAGFYIAKIGDSDVDNIDELAQLNTLRSALQNNTKIQVYIYTAGACPTPDLSKPGATFIDGQTAIVHINIWF
jgi:hypothetical protein